MKIDIDILSFPDEDLQYAINCMDICDLIAFSLRSKHTKNLVKSSNRKIESSSVYIYENHIRFGITTRISKNSYAHTAMDLFDSYIKLDDRSGVKYWRKEEFTRNNWIAHLLDIFNHQSMIATLAIENVSLSYLDTVKQVIPKCNSLEIRHTCSDDVAKMAFFKLSLIVVQSVKVRKNIFRKDNDISKFLTPNLKYVSFDDPEYPFKLISDDLLTLNSDNLSIEPANITEKELNKFLKLWMKRNHTFYRPKVIELFLKNGTEIDEEEVFKGVKYEAKYDEQRLKRRDGKELDVYIAYNYIKFQFK